MRIETNWWGPLRWIHSFTIIPAKNAHQSRINILQIGDSHIQADFLSEKVRNDIQSDFGNAGRGVVYHCGLAGTNDHLFTK